MAVTTYGTNNALAVKLWAKKLFVEALQETVAMKFVGRTPSSMIQMKDETGKSAGDKITIGLRMQLTGAGVSGDGTLQDNEEALTTYNDSIFIDQLRWAVRSGGKMSEQRVTFDVREEAKSGLVDWFSDRYDTWAFNQLCGYTPQTDTKYTGLQATIAPDSNHRIGVGGASDATLNTATTSTFDITMIDKAVERARTLSPGIRPIKVMGGEYYVVFLHPYQVTDLRISTTAGQWYDIQKAAMTGGTVQQNPIFTGAMGMYNNTIIHVDKRVTTGAATTTDYASVRRAVFCGAQAALWAFGRDYAGAPDALKWVEQLFDYENQLGVAAGVVAGLKKTVFNSADFATIVLASYAVQH